MWATVQRMGHDMRIDFWMPAPRSRHNTHDDRAHIVATYGRVGVTAGTERKARKALATLGIEVRE